MLSVRQAQRKRLNINYLNTHDTFEILKLFFTNKWFVRIIIVITGILLGYFLQPKGLRKYIGRLEKGTNQMLADGQRIGYFDLDNDGISEELIYYHMSDSRQPVINQYSGEGEFQNTWNLEGEVVENFDFITGDYNRDSINEVFIFSFFENSLCLYGLAPGKSKRFIIEKIPIYTFTNKIDYHHVVIHEGGVADINADGYGEVIFSVNSKFTPHPRRIFAYDIFNDTLLSSPELGLQLVGSPILYDFDNDNKPEIFLSSLNNTNQARIKPRDQAQYSSSIVLQCDLTYFMVPTLYEGTMSVTSVFPVVLTQNKYIGTLSWSLQKKEAARLMLLNKNGEIIHQKQLPPSNYIFDPKRNNWNQIMLFSRQGEAQLFDEDLNLLKTLNLHGNLNQVAFLDIENDHQQELLLVQNNKLKIYRNNFKNLVEIDIPGLAMQKVHFSVKKESNAKNLISIQNNNQHYLVSYAKNKYYWLSYMIYLGTILGTCVIAHLLTLFHNVTVKRIKKENEKFYLMQMELIRNQLDPHFLFNALNSISFSINKDERKTAYYNLGLFSKFLRESIITLDDFSRSLDEELDYVKNYLALEKFRFKEKFDYDFIIGPGVNKAQKVPKLILFSFVESALKKSILPKNMGGRIEITIDTYESKGIYIMISDTGLFRDLANSEESHTKNMQMMKRIASYFNQYNQKKIEIKIRDGGTPDSPAGCTVEISIPPEYKYMV